MSYWSHYIKKLRRVIFINTISKSLSEKLLRRECVNRVTSDAPW